VQFNHFVDGAELRIFGWEETKRELFSNNICDETSLCFFCEELVQPYNIEINCFGHMDPEKGIYS
jgi:hypothetical protein